jgi:hypothetical protein
MKTTPDASRNAPATEKTSRSTAGTGTGEGHPNGEAGDEETIRLAAYALYEARGRVDGHAIEDWEAARALVTRSETESVSHANV